MSIIVNKNDIIQYKMLKLLNSRTNCGKKIKDLVSKKNDIYIIFILKDEEYKKIHIFPKGKELVNYVNSDSFIGNIKSIYYILYNEKHKLCEIRNVISDSKHLKLIKNLLITYFPDITLWSGIVSPEHYKLYIENDFNNPYKCYKSPLGYKLKNEGIAFTWKNQKDTLDQKSVENVIKYLEEKKQSNKSNFKCNIYAKFSADAIKYLQKINEQDHSDIELSGSLLVKKVSDIDGKIVYELYSETSSVISGEKESVDAVWSRYNFHTHPKKAYANHGVKKGWPSSQDYVGFLDLNNNTIFHTVVTIEGLYVISISPEWKGNTEKINRKYILREFDIDHESKMSFEEYVDSINNKKYKEKSLFIVKFLEWYNANEIFPIFYEKTEGSCLATDNVFDIHKVK
jgi:hypothetical protein